MTNYNFTDAVRDVLARARECASSLGHDYVSADHIAIAMLERPHSEMQSLTGPLGLDLGALAAAVRSGQQSRSATVEFGELPYLDSGKHLIEDAMRLSDHCGHDVTGVDHLFVAAASRVLLLSTALASRGQTHSTLMDVLSKHRSHCPKPKWKLW